MNNQVRNYASVSYAILRIVAGLMFFMHGSQKMFGVPGSENPVDVTSLMGFGGMVELIGGGFIALGLFTRAAALLSSGQMAIAYFMVHFGQHPLPIINKGETAVLFCFIFLHICTYGPGIWSIDKLLNQKP